jgi:hypothetical protein
MIVFGLSLGAQNMPSPAKQTETTRSNGAGGGGGAASDSPDGILSRAAAQRNENIQVNLIDNDATKEANVRMGNNVTVLSQVPAETSAYAGEYGRAASESIAIASAPDFTGFHFELYDNLQNSIFNARTFFQVGGVQPSRQNTYGLRFTTKVLGLGVVTGSFSQHHERGMVNGNVQVPLPSERTPLAADPAAREFITRILEAFPAQLPNRTDLDPRLLNTNAPQSTDRLDGSLRLDRGLGPRNHLSVSYSVSRLRIDAFQLVAGLNPDTEIHGHRARLGFTHSFSPSSQVAMGFAFTRSLSDLRSDPTAVGPCVFTGHVLQDLGPDIPFPVHRAANTFRWGAVFSHAFADGHHLLTWGGDLSRNQINGFESVNSRGEYDFRNTAQHTAVENLLLGLPAWYEVTLGSLTRGFRNLDASLFIADQWKVTPSLQVYYGLRYSPVTAPKEVNGLNAPPYGCDCNNFSPRFSIAYRLPKDWLLRTSYTVSFGEIYPVTYGQVRLNAPLAHRIQLQNPDLLNPLGAVDLNDPTVRQSPTSISPDLVSPYSHQYNFSLERRLGARSGSPYLLRLGYIGSRTFKLLDAYWLNRAVPVSGVPLTSNTVDQRRPDPRYYDVRSIVNGGAAYLDAAQASLVAPYRRGLTFTLTYTFGKALDTGSNYASTAAKTDISKFRAQTQFDSQKDRKALSDFDSTHSLMLSLSYDLPHVPAPRAMGWLLDRWQLSGAALVKTGTPFTLLIGADGPGYGNVDGLVSERPNLLDTSILGSTIGDPDTASQILSRDRFSYLAPGQLAGTLGRNTFRKGGIRNINAALSKQYRFGGRSGHTATLRAEAFNLTNRPQFDAPLYLLTNPSFGKIINTLNNGRVLRLGVYFVY